jgi:hypothetical protein
MYGAFDVRYAPESGAKADIARLPPCAKSCRERSQQDNDYSMTSSARASSSSDSRGNKSRHIAFFCQMVFVINRFGCARVLNIIAVAE